jgi:soluble lytic murein transglycosylase-like protein
MPFRRWLMAVASLAALAAPAAAQVQLTVRADGRKVIYNLSGRVKKRDTSSLAWLAKQHDRPSRFDSIISHYAEDLNVDPVLVKAVIQVESNFDPQCVSRRGARGLMQLMPETARRFGVQQVHDPEDNIRGGVKYLAFLLKFFSNDLSRALAAYNAGENAVLKYGGIPPYDETQSYVQRALTVYHGAPWGSIQLGGGLGGGRKLRGGFKSATTASVRLAAGGGGAFGSLR